MVDDGAVCVQQRVPELTALVDRSRRLGRTVTRHAARKRELPEERSQTLRVVREVAVPLRVRALEPRARVRSGTAMARPGDEERVEVVLANEAIRVRVHEIEARHRAEVTEQPTLDVLRCEWLAQQRVREQVDLADGQIVRGAPPGVDPTELV